MAHYQADGQHPAQAAHPAPAAGRAGQGRRALLRGAHGRGGLLLRLLACSTTATSRRRSPTYREWTVGDLSTTAEPPAAAAPPQAARPVRRRGRSRTPTSSPAGGCVLGNGDVRISYAVAGAPSPWYRNGIGDECVYVERGRARVETVFGAFDVGEGDYVIIPRATTHRWVPQALDARTRCAPTASRPTATSRRRSATSASTASCSSTRRTASATCALPQGPLLAEDVGARADDETEVYIKHRGNGPGRRRRHGAHAALPPARRRRLGRLPLPLRVQRRATSSRSPAASTSRRRCTRCSRAGTS